MAGERDVAVRKMMEACDKDPAHLARLFKDPDAVAKEFGVRLDDNEKAQLAKVAQMYQIIDEFTAGRTFGPGPIFYPIDVWWRRKLFDHILRYRPLYYPIFYPIFYPLDIRQIDVARQFEGLRMRRR